MSSYKELDRYKELTSLIEEQEKAVDIFREKYYIEKEKLMKLNYARYEKYLDTHQSENHAKDDFYRFVFIAHKELSKKLTKRSK
tara:strand:- start:251 stop:502 length:252 start_codon:yes stop_codon:yes gene_type:complete